MGTGVFQKSKFSGLPVILSKHRAGKSAQYHPIEASEEYAAILFPKKEGGD
jgi:hypothetical protein